MNKTELLRWQIEMGADESINEFPSNHLSETPMKSAAVKANKAAASLATSGVAAAIQKAKESAERANTLEELRKAVADFDGLAIKKTATNMVFADGNPKASVMLIGEAPGANEDQEGIPFCGMSGKLLDTMIGAIGLKRTENAYITNTIFWRPPGNRRPTPEELAICRPFVEKHIALINPRMLILVGGTATAALLDDKLSISRLRGKFHTYKTPYLDKEFPVGVLFHPSYLLRSPLQKRTAWHDLLLIQAFLQK